jgi:Ca-activated chloride channel family protein
VIRNRMMMLVAGAALIAASCASPATDVAKTETPVGPGIASPTPSANERERVVVTGSLTQDATRPAEPAPQLAYAPPLPAPPPPVGLAAPMPRMEAGRAMGYAGGAQTSPQPTPGDIDRDRYQNTPINPVKVVAEEPVSTFSIDVDTASYSNVRRFLNNGSLPPKDAVRIEELINYFDYDYALPRDRTAPFATTVSVTPSPWNEGRQLMHIGIQGYNIENAERPALNLTLLVDVSGSMSGEDRLPLAIRAMKLLVEQLRPKDRVSIAVYAGAAGTVLEPTSDRARINAALDNLHAGGSTAGGEGLRLAYSLARQNYDRNSVNRVVLMTDGDFNVGISDPERLKDFVERERESGVYLSVFGFGRSNYNDALMQQLAQNGNGIAAYIDTLNEARKVFNDDFQGSMFTIANDVKIQVEFNPAKVAEYRLIGYETRMLNREDFNNDRVDAGDIGAGASVTAIYEITPVGSSARLVDPSRYQRQVQPVSNSTASELAFLRLRYKRPGETESRLIERPITARDSFATLAAAPESTRFAAAVAGYGVLLRGDPHVQTSFGWEQVVELANGARGRDEFGYRTEFVQLARLAKTAASQSPLPRPGGVGQ